VNKPWLKWFLYLLLGSWLIASVFGSLIARLILFLRPPKTRMCPKCGYKMVADVALRPREGREGTPLAYAVCKACKERYKHWGPGPFHSVTEEEWANLSKRVF
jgi:hypothetical protein